MAKILKRTVDGLQPEPNRDAFAWDGELRGFGVRGRLVVERAVVAERLGVRVSQAARLGPCGACSAMQLGRSGSVADWSDALVEVSTVVNPYGRARIVDRDKLDSALRKAASRSGSVVIELPSLQVEV